MAVKVFAFTLGRADISNKKTDYIHQNPVQAGLVYRAEDYIYSSASNYIGSDY